MSWGSLFHPKDTYGWRALPNKPLAHRYVVRETVRGKAFVSLYGKVKRFYDCFIDPTEQQPLCKNCVKEV
jgi:hypothetical protein